MWPNSRQSPPIPLSSPIVIERAGLMKAHLHDLAIASDHQFGVGELQPADEDLLIDPGPVADFHVGVSIIVVAPM